METSWATATFPEGPSRDPPTHAAQQTEPKLGPGTGHDGTAVVLDELASPNADIAIGIGAQKTQGNVRNNRSKHSRGTFDVRAPPTVRLLMYREVVSHQRTLFGFLAASGAVLGLLSIEGGVCPDAI